MEITTRTSSRDKPVRKYRYSDEEGEDEEPEAGGRRKKTKKAEQAASDSESEALKGEAAGDEPKAGEEDSDSQTSPAPASKASTTTRPQRSTRGPIKDFKDRNSDDSEDSLRRENSKGDLSSRHPSSRTRSPDNLVAAIAESKSEEDTKGQGGSTANGGKTLKESPRSPSPEIDMEEPSDPVAPEATSVENAEADDAAPVVTPAAEPAETSEKEENEPGKEDTPAAEGRPPNAGGRGQRDAGEPAKGKASRIGRGGIKKPTAKALARVKRGHNHSDSEASNEDGYHSDASVSSNHGPSRF